MVVVFQLILGCVNNMEIDGKEVPFTATHYSLNSREFIRFGRGEYAECLVDGKHWVECGTLRNSELPRKSFSEKYMRLFKTGMARDFCNIRLFFIGSSYRIR